ncbi:MAG TPA: PKD domain-containing protein, partial [Ohtaekwangia sp.]
ITPDFCQEGSPPLTNFDARFHDVSVGTVTANTRWRWEFYNESNVMVAEFPGAGGFSSTILGPFDRVFTNPGIYRVRLITRDNITFCQSVDEVQVRVFRKPVADFTATEVCVGNATTFTDASTLIPIGTEQIATREWDLNYDGVTFDSDPTLLNQTTFTHTFAAAGNYRVALRVTTNQGSCSDIVDQQVVVNPLPLATFSATPLSGCSILDVTFTNTSVAGQPDVVDQYIWEVDAGSGFQVDSIQRPTDPGFGPTYSRGFENTTAGNVTYRVRLRVLSANGCERISSTQLITVNPGPESGFVSMNYSPFNSNCSPVSVDFAVDAQTISLNPSDYTWTITGSSGQVDQISTGTTPAFTYSFVNTTQSIQDFQISLETTLPTGCSGDSTRIIRVNPVPNSDFTITTIEDNCQHLVINLDATQKGLAGYDWIIEINNVPVFSSAADNFDYEIIRSATIDQNISISLQTLNFANCQSTITMQDFDVLQNTPIVADFDATPLSQTLPSATVTLTNNSTPGPWTYLWDFGDGTTSNNPAVTTHSYTMAGTYVITLTVGDAVCSDTHTETITINPAPPVLDFDYAPASGCSPLTVTFTNLSQFADPSTYLWEFGAGQGTSQVTHPVYTYFDPGVYSVTLSASDGAGGRVSITKNMIITVLPSPLAQFAVFPQLVNIPQDLLYTDNRTQGAVSFLWDFGDGTTSTEFEPTHKYETEGAFDIVLIATGENGCVDTARYASAVNVVASGQLLIPNAFRPSLVGPGQGDKFANQIFIPLTQKVSEFNMMVFNRWGDLLFETDDQEQGWDGYYKGALCPQDVYIYKITVRYNDGNKFTKTGDVTLIR